MEADAKQTVLCFGEILWDVLPTGKYAGGAPFNVAYHLHNLGLVPVVVSSVGDDSDGRELCDKLAAWGISTRGITMHASLPTGTVKARLSAKGDASYDIVTDVAWDDIATSDYILAQASSCRALVFGSLAQRSPFNQVALETLLAALPVGAERVFDVNFRPPFVDAERIVALARHSTLLKLNAAEAAQLAAGEKEDAGREETHARLLAEKCGATAICITAGSRGAGFLDQDVWHWEPGQEMQVADTVGAGDSFLAGFLAARLAGLDPRTCLIRACRLGEWVASQRGGTPSYDSRPPGN